jgi:hypothetical protein
MDCCPYPCRFAETAFVAGVRDQVVKFRVNPKRQAMRMCVLWFHVVALRYLFRDSIRLGQKKDRTPRRTGLGYLSDRLCKIGRRVDIRIVGVAGWYRIFAVLCMHVGTGRTIQHGCWPWMAPPIPIQWQDGHNSIYIHLSVKMPDVSCIKNQLLNMQRLRCI